MEYKDGVPTTLAERDAEDDVLIPYVGVREELRVTDADKDTVRDTLADAEPTPTLLRETVVVDVTVTCRVTDADKDLLLDATLLWLTDAVRLRLWVKEEVRDRDTLTLTVRKPDTLTLAP